MKTRTEILELTQADLVDLFSTATYGSAWLSISAQDRRHIVADEDDCREDIWAKVLLAGDTIVCTDNYAEGECYGKLPCTIDEDENADYTLSLQDIKNGLQKCADGEMGSWCATAFRAFQEGEGGMDNPMAEMLMQAIIFGELIY